ncbi:GNAT family N-acetyltransferase [Streptomyces sp. NPDC095613]|uniref:GNAT family N-acetyltransferase n=1 Tax=Streptomyces sp. NPDC095613 TaxID=3155540 RepID=UPI0033333F16
MTRMTMRPYVPADQAAVLDLVNADRLPGQPSVGPAMLNEALKGADEGDNWWGAFGPPTVQVAIDPAGELVGAISCAVRAKDDAGVVLWLHCREDEAVAEALITRALAVLPTRPVEAFQFATALTQGLEALPVGHRPATHAALERAGFVGERLWRYMRADLPRPGLPRAEGALAVPDPDRPAARRMEVRQDGRTVAEAVIGPPKQGIGVLWWIEVSPGARRQGLGRAMLGSALDALTGLGATQAVLYVDDDEPPGGERDRTAANALYESAGFVEVDRLWSYTLRAAESDPTSRS